MTRRERIRIALPKCAELGLICDHFRACGFAIPDLSTPSLHLIKDPLNSGFDFEVFRLAAADVGTYVDHGISHVGVMGTDLLRETDAEVWRPLTFPFGKYPIVFAAPRGESVASLSARPQIRIATPFPKFTRDIFAHRGMAVEVMAVADSVTACLLGLADGYIDRLVDPGPMLKHDFRVVEALGYTRLKLVVNRACGSRRRTAIQLLIRRLEENKPQAPPPVQIPFDDEDDHAPLPDWVEDEGAQD